MKKLEDLIQECPQAIGQKKEIEQWNGLTVYSPIYDRPQGGCYGLPLFILENEDGDCRWATYDETMDIMDALPNEDK